MNLEKDQLFCLLGPNGAGKTTTISCLTGITPITGGDGKYHSRKQQFVVITMNMLTSHFEHLTALIYGHSVRSTAGMSNIRRMIGVCPQVGVSNIHLL